MTKNAPPLSKKKWDKRLAIEMKTRIFTTSFALLLSFLFLALPAYAVQVTITDLGVLPGDVSSNAVAINDAGQVVGNSTDSSGNSHAFFWTSSGGMLDLGVLPGDVNSQAVALNDAGQVVGINTDYSRSFFWTSSGGMQDLGTLPGYDVTAARSINGSGQIVGYSIEHSPSFNQHAVLWTSSGGMQDLGVLPGNLWSHATAINDAGQVVGQNQDFNQNSHPFFWTNTGGMIDLGFLGDLPCWAVAINDGGQVAGGGEEDAFFWTASGGMLDLGKLPGYVNGMAVAINDLGQVVGNSTNSFDSTNGRAFLWTSSEGMIDLGTLSGDVSSNAVAINDAGQIVGTSIDSSGNGHAVLWTVTPAVVPDAPRYVTATGGNAQATVSFTTPASNGGSPITGYTVSGGGTDTNAGSLLTIHTITGLTNGNAYTFTVVATNAVGPSLPSLPSNTVTPATVPGAPTGVTATGGNTQATVNFTAPASNGGSPITGYTVYGGGVDNNAKSLATTHTIIGLTNETAYTFTVIATNAVGPSLPSLPSNSVTPTSLTFFISGTVKTSTGVAISGVTITLGGGKTASVTTNSKGNYTFTGLYNGLYTVTASETGYTFTPSIPVAVTLNSANQTKLNFTGTAIPTYSISGTVKTSTGKAISGVTMTLTLGGNTIAAMTTSKTSTYTFKGLYNGLYTVTPSETGYTFTPQFLKVTVSGANQAGQNFTRN